VTIRVLEKRTSVGISADGGPQRQQPAGVAGFECVLDMAEAVSIRLLEIIRAGKG